MKKLFTLLLTVLLAVGCCFGLTACGETPTVALITLHGEDSTYDKNFIDAFKEACANKGLNKNQYAIVSDIPEKNECYETAAKLADQGCKGIFADSFGHEDFMIKAAKEFTNVQFYHATGYKSQIENLANYHNAFASIYEGRYIAGYAAGLKLLTMTDKAVDNNFKLGYIGAFTYAEVISGYSSWYLGVKSALDEFNAENGTAYTCTMDVTFTGSWYDEAGEKAAAETLISSGAVLVSQHADSMGAPTACDTANVPNVAYNGLTGKNTLVAYSKINWVPYFEMMIEKALGGADVATDWTGTISTNSVQWALGPGAAAGSQEKLVAIENELKNGTRKVFDCSNFTVAGVQLTVSDPNVVLDAATGITYFAESATQSAPYFDLEIDGITRLDVRY